MPEEKPKAATQRKAAERQRKREKGLVPKEIWCLPEHWEKIQDFIKKLHKNK